MVIRNSSPVLIIAEAGVNHNGSIEIAKSLVDVAAKAGADYVKFQTFTAINQVIRLAEKADYQKINTKNSESQFEMLRRLELSLENHQILIEYCISKNIGFLSTAFDLDSVDLLVSLGQRLFKIPSGEITNLPYLEKISQVAKKIIISTGMANMNEIGDAVAVFTSHGISKSNISLLHCTTEYPAPMSEVNLKAMLSIQSQFGMEVGYSDHTMGIEIPIAAVSLGAKIIEKHFTLDRKMSGPDHACSLTPHELKSMIQSIRNVELALGDGEKKATMSELRNINVVRKSIVASKKILAGEVLTVDNVTTKRPGIGISPMEWHSVIGSVATKNFDIDEMISLK
jgi:N,N'-diacetyllegionaminate synthase